MNHHGGAFVNRRRRLNKKAPGMKQRQDDEHNVVKVHFKKNVGIQAVEKCFAVTQYGTFR